jgi:hypothetical protein
VLWHGITVTYLGSCCLGHRRMLPLDFCEHGVEVGTSELPFEGSGDPLVMVLEVEQPGLHLDEVGEVVGGEHLALHDGEVDLYLALSQEACTGRWTSTRLDQAPCSRLMEARPR